MGSLKDLNQGTV